MTNHIKIFFSARRAREQSRTHRAHRHGKQLGNFRVAQPFVLAQQEHFALDDPTPRRKPPYRDSFEELVPEE